MGYSKKMFKSFFNFTFIIIYLTFTYLGNPNTCFASELSSEAKQIYTKSNEYNLSEENKVYSKVNNVTLYTKDGNYKLSELCDRTPIIMAFIFSRCAGICSPFLSGLADNFEKIDTKLKYKILVISFDPRDSVKDMDNIAQRFSLDKNDKWIFATTDQIDTLNASIGFNPIWNEKNLQYDHEALLVGINENGYIKKKLTGLRGTDELSKMISEINNEFIPAYPLQRENMLFSCFTFDPKTGKTQLSYGLLVMAVPAISTLLLIIWFATKKPNNSKN